MKNSEKNLNVIQNFLLYMTHCEDDEKEIGFKTLMTLTPKMMYQIAEEYVKSDHIDGESRDTDHVSDLSVEELFYSVIKPGIVNMAVSDKLPTDLTTLDLTDVLRNTKFEHRPYDLHKLDQLISIDDHEGEILDGALKALVAQSKVDDSVMADDIVTPAEQFEYSFTVKSILELISYE